MRAIDSTVATPDPEARTIDTSEALIEDDDFGRYRVLRPLGEGEMGSVYLAEQLEPISRLVALKVVKLGMDTGQVLIRFHNERQALALMDHPNIAQIHDAGATSKGRPYFVMEYIEGAPITEYCDRKRMTANARLALFLAVCRAVQHAHQKGVIHRDLKPSNVLVAEQDGVPVPKVIDFGIAKATDKWAVENTLLTQFGQIVGTPEYASPEQVDTMNGDIDEASDVYSLGVLLYELLIGAVPFDTATLRNVGLAEMLRIIREEEAPSLLRKLTSMGVGATDIAARRQTDPASLRRLVDGDLNSIAMTALEKTRERRYASAADLAADIQRYLDHMPVLASPPSRLYRAHKFLRRHRLAAAGTTVGIVFLGLIGLTAWSLLHSASRPKLTEKDAIVLADFDNRTGDTVFDDTLRQGLAVELQQSPFLSLLPDVRIRQTLALMGQPRDARVTSEVAREICERTGSSATLAGSIAPLGSQYVVGLRATSCATGTTLDQEQAQAARREDVLKTLSQMARQFRTRVGESLATVEKHSPPLPEATTSSLEALKAYSTGFKLGLSSGVGPGAPFFRRATEIDPQFALAWSSLGHFYLDTGQTELAAESSLKAWQLRDRVSGPEKFMIEWDYYRNVTGNLEKAYQALELWSQAYPRAQGTPNPRGLLASGLASAGTGRFEKMLEMSRQFPADPNNVFGYHGPASSYFFLDRFPEAEATLQRAFERKLTNPYLLLIHYNIAVLKNDMGQMDRITAMAKGQARAEHAIAHASAIGLARSGRLRAARQASKRAVDLARQESEKEPAEAANYGAARGVWEALCGYSAEGATSAAAALDLSKDREVQYAAGLAWALAGELSRSEEVAAELDRRRPEDTFVKFTYVPVLRALAALGRGNAAESGEYLEITRRYEMAVSGLNFNHYYLGGLHSAYVRGQALTAAHRYTEAAAEFQKILDHRGIVGIDPIGALAHWQIGRAFVLSGDKARAKAAYEAFLQLWKDADPDVPALKRAKVEYQKLLQTL